MTLRRPALHTVACAATTGLIGGLLASWVMNRVPALLPHPRGDEHRHQQQGQAEESSTVKVARGISREVAGQDLEQGTEAAAGSAVHFAFGGLMGAVYGALSAFIPGVTVGHGLGWGLFLWAAGDEAALPLLGLSRSPSTYPMSRHAMALASHGVYGVTTDLVRRTLSAIASARRAPVAALVRRLAA